MIQYQGELAPGHPSVSPQAGALDRGEESIWMRKGNLDSMAPSVHVAGLGKARKLTVDIWAGYESEPDRIPSKARSA